MRQNSYLSRFLIGRDGLSVSAFLGKKLIFPGPFICCLCFWDIICYWNRNVFRQWLKNTQINFPWEKEHADPEGFLFLSSSCSDAIDFIVKPEQRGLGSYLKLREGMQEKSHYFSMFTEWLMKSRRATHSEPLFGEEKFSKAALASPITLIVNSMTGILKNEVMTWNSGNPLCLFHIYSLFQF